MEYFTLHINHAYVKKHEVVWADWGLMLHRIRTYLFFFECYVNSLDQQNTFTKKTSSYNIHFEIKYVVKFK